MAGPNLPTNRTTASTIAEHVSDHNASHGVVNKIDKDAAPAMSDALVWDSVTSLYLPQQVSGENIKKHGATTGATDNAAALTAACAASTEVYIPAGTWNFTTAPTIPSNVRLTFAWGAEFVWNGAGVFITLSAKTRIKFNGGKFRLTAANQTIFDINGSYHCSWVQCRMEGLHDVGTSTTYQTQVGLKFRSNAGDNRIIDCSLNNLGEAVQAQSIMNYMVGTMVTQCWVGVHVSGAAFSCGLIVDNCTIASTLLVGTAGQAKCGFLIDASANQSSITNSWFEGWETAIQLGVNTGSPGGPIGATIANVKLAATTKCLDIQYARQTRLDTVRFSQDPSATPTELIIDATNAPDGFASNLISTAIFEIPRSVFPVGWTHFGRQGADAQIATQSMFIGNGSAAIPSYITLGNSRARFGYDATSIIMSDLGGGRNLVLRSGSTPRDLVTADSAGVVHLGAKAASNQAMVLGVFIANATTVPTGNPTGGGFLYVESGALKYRGSGGTITTLGPA